MSIFASKSLPEAHISTLNTGADAEVDPIFALIEAHRSAVEQNLAAVEEYDRLEAEFADNADFSSALQRPLAFELIESSDRVILKRRKEVGLASQATTPDFDTTSQGIAAREKIRHTTVEAKRAQISVLCARPTTLAGAAAIIRYAMAGQYEPGGNCRIEETILGDAFNGSGSLPEKGVKFFSMIAQTIEHLAEDPAGRNHH
jgi:hypothetical protein